jgi:hypothetical protein
MRIVENSVSRLALKDRTLWIAAVCILAAGFMISQAVAHHQPINFYFALFVVATFGLAFLQMTDVVFDKTHRVATLRKLTVIRLKRTTIHFADILDVTVQIAPQPSDADSIMCRLAFRTQDAVIPMTAGHACIDGRPLTRAEYLRGCDRGAGVGRKQWRALVGTRDASPCQHGDHSQ